MMRSTRPERPFFRGSIPCPSRRPTTSWPFLFLREELWSKLCWNSKWWGQSIQKDWKGLVDASERPEIRIWGSSEGNWGWCWGISFPQITVLDTDLSREKGRSTVSKRLQMATEGVLMHGVLNEQSSPGHSWSGWAQNLVCRVVLSVWVRMSGVAQGLNNYLHIILIPSG